MSIDYEWDPAGSRILTNGPLDMDLSQTLTCGQCFRWRREKDGSYSGIVRGRMLNAAQTDNGLVFSGCNRDDFESFWIDYFDLLRDYAAIRETLSGHDPGMRKAVAAGAGIRILQQEPWEMLVSFIISQNANIPRIMKCVESLCALRGEPVEGPGGRIGSAFPTPESIGGCSAGDLDACRLGYRCEYIRKTAAQIQADGGIGMLERLKSESSAAAAAYLNALHGVGPKVADCVLLFGLGFRDRFPADVWIRRAMAALYGFDERDTAGIAAFARAEFGALAGYAQQYLFQYIRQS